MYFERQTLKEVTMRYLRMLIVMTAIVFVAAGSARGITSPGRLLLGSSAVTAPNSTVGQLFVAASAEDGKGGDEKNPPSRSIHCPPDKDNHHDINYRDDDHKGGDNQDKDNKDNKDNKDKDHQDNCGKGDDGKNP
jgi:hypothetical protein